MPEMKTGSVTTHRGVENGTCGLVVPFRFYRGVGVSTGNLPKGRSGHTQDKIGVPSACSLPHSLYWRAVSQPSMHATIVSAADGRKRASAGIKRRLAQIARFSARRHRPRHAHDPPMSPAPSVLRPCKPTDYRCQQHRWYATAVIVVSSYG